MINNILLKSVLLKSLRTVRINPIRLESHSSSPINKIGTREVVGFGMNGELTYSDSVLFPYPAVRFREITPDLKALKEKEKGDWRALTIEEKKCLYRVSFCQTFEEMIAPTGEWKKAVGILFICIGIGIYLHLLSLILTNNPKGWPQSFSEESLEKQFKRIIDLRMNPIDGIASKWDYENNCWKK